MSASIGISLYPQDGDEPGSLLRNADAAMLESKKGGHAYVVSNRGALDSSAKLRFVTRLRKAVESQRWTLHYQPVLDLATGRMRGVEALIRWIEADGTMVPPGDFIPVAEELGLIEAIGDWVVRELVYQSQAWRELDIDLSVSFNLSPRQFWQPDLAKGILERIGEGGVDPSKVVVEITESSAMADPDRAQAILEDLHAGGLRIAIDDFGTGYSSLARIREMPVDVLKIDRSFVSGVDVDPQNQSIVAAFIELARGLGLTTLAEGHRDGGRARLRSGSRLRDGPGLLLLEGRAARGDHRDVVRWSARGERGPLAGDGQLRSSAVRTARTIASASIPAQARSSSGAPDPGISVTASLITRADAGTPSASAPSTASPRPPSIR